MDTNKSPLDMLPRFIWGNATKEHSESGIDEHKYLTHLRYPRFICRIMHNPDMATGHNREVNLDSEIGMLTESNTILYVCRTHCILMSDFVFLEEYEPSPDELQKACDDAVINLIIFDDALGILDKHNDL